MGRPDSEAPASSFAAGRAAVHGHEGGADSPSDTNVVIILAALFFALLLAIGLSFLARWALRYVGRGASVDVRATARVAYSGSGIKRRVLRGLPVEVYASGEDIDDVCAICLGEFVDGEKVRVLPQCAHGFHVRCVDAWLLSHSSCPTCRRPVIQSAPAKAGDGGIGRKPVTSVPPRPTHSPWSSCDGVSEFMGQRSMPLPLQYKKGPSCSSLRHQVYNPTA